jgi:antitoxin VapB
MATAKLFMNGRSQAVRLPAEFRFDGAEVDVERDPATGGVLLLPKREESKRQKDWEDFLERLRLNPVEEEFLSDRNDEILLPRDIF